MARKKLILLLFIYLVCGGCATSAALMKEALNAPAKNLQSEEKISSTTPVSFAIKQDGAEININAYIRRPEIKALPKTLVILVPGSGDVSHKGESISDGLKAYDQALELYSLWAKALSDKGFFVLSYDKRSCSPEINALCKAQPTKDIDRLGIDALASDLDQIFLATQKILLSSGEATNIILMSTTQGAQVIAKAECREKATAIILLSPIAGNLADKWVSGLKRANNMGEAETIKSFFSLLESMPETKRINGASVAFWRSWIESSKNTVKALASLSHTPVLVLFSDRDVFNFQESFLKDESFIKNRHKFTLKTTAKSDRNFIINKQLSSGAVDEVVSFIKKNQQIKVVNNPKSS